MILLNAKVLLGPFHKHMDPVTIKFAQAAAPGHSPEKYGENTRLGYIMSFEYTGIELDYDRPRIGKITVDLAFPFIRSVFKAYEQCVKALKPVYPILDLTEENLPRLESAFSSVAKIEGDEQKIFKLLTGNARALQFLPSSSKHAEKTLPPEDLIPALKKLGLG